MAQFLYPKVDHDLQLWEQLPCTIMDMHKWSLLSPCVLSLDSRPLDLLTLLQPQLEYLSFLATSTFITLELSAISVLRVPSEAEFRTMPGCSCLTVNKRSMHLTLTAFCLNGIIFLTVTCLSVFLLLKIVKEDFLANSGCAVYFRHFCVIHHLRVPGRQTK